ncbi:MAG: hypothetical protein KDI71_22105 [Xanthomonadales bacterium]|nr:hypothetical protein [Anaerolineae bacterium]MCB1609666.1 hypothetical protein [Xanthomonadales bacterium]
MVTDSPQWRQLSGNAVKAFMVLISKYNGKNNGVLALPRSELRKFGFGANGVVVAKAIAELEDAGFVITTRPGGCVLGAALYAITTEPIDSSPKHDWEAQHAPMHSWRKTDRTDPVQRPAPIQCKAKRSGNRPGTESVPKGRETVTRPRTVPVHFFKSTKAEP